jgi:hypothetical protein
MWMFTDDLADCADADAWTGNTVRVVDRWTFWRTAGWRDSPEDALQQEACEGWVENASPMFVGRVAWVVFAAFAMLAQQSAQCIEA